MHLTSKSTSAETGSLAGFQSANPAIVTS